MSTIDSRTIMQVNILVDDVERVARNYAQAFGMKMPNIWTHPDPNNSVVKYKGKFEEVGQLKICVFQFGPLALELAQVIDGKNSSWQDYLSKYGYGVHNIGMYVNDLQGALQALANTGCTPIHTGYFVDESYTIVEAEKQFGCRLNIKHAGEDNHELLANLPDHQKD